MYVYEGFLKWGYLQIIQVMDDHDFVSKPMVTWGYQHFKERQKSPIYVYRIHQTYSHGQTNSYVYGFIMMCIYVTLVIGVIIP